MYAAGAFLFTVFVMLPPIYPHTHLHTRSLETLHRLAFPWIPTITIQYTI